MNLTQTQFAALLHVSKSTLCKWEKGVNTPDLANLKNIADILSLSVDEVINAQRFSETNSQEELSFLAEISTEKKPGHKKRFKTALLSGILVLSAATGVLFFIFRHNINRGDKISDGCYIIDYYYDSSPDIPYGDAYCFIINSEQPLTDDIVDVINRNVHTSYYNL